MEHDELVKRLRCLKYGHCPDCPMWYSEEVEPNLWRERCAAIDAADAIEELSRSKEDCDACGAKTQSVIESLQKKIPRWIPVSERLPKEMDRSCGGWSAEIRPSDDVLVWLSSEKRQSVAWYSHTYNEWTTVDENTVYCFDEITHWQSLSEPPKGE